MLLARPLFSVLRGGHEEICVHGEIALIDAGGCWVSGDHPSYVPARSLLKPLQFQATGLADTEAELALRRVPALGSISATAPQVAELCRWHAGSPLFDHLRVPAALPVEPLHRARLLDAGAAPSRHFNPCFSKHMAILSACERRGWSLEDYTRESHPFHRELMHTLAQHIERPVERVQFVTDGCGLPTPVLSTLELARIYHAIAVAKGGSLARIRRAMLSHPDWIGASGRIDTRLMQLNPGRVIAKEGADGLLAVAATESSGTSAFALVVKLAAGYLPASAATALVPFLEARKLVALCELSSDQEILWHVRPDRSSPLPTDVSPELHEGIAVWPGDVPFKRDLTSEIGATSSPSAPSWELAVSSIHTTLHVGAHADAPSHFAKDGAGIDRVALRPYRGPCQVVACGRRGSLIYPGDLDSVDIRAPRLLFKTGSYPDPDAFNTDFCAFSAELIEWAVRRGVLLIGIDTPSVDPFDSKTLPAHHATRRHPGIAIIEGLDLSRADPGLYELVALPLKLRGADASPVRAALWPLR